MIALKVAFTFWLIGALTSAVVGVGLRASSGKGDVWIQRMGARTLVCAPIWPIVLLVLSCKRGPAALRGLWADADFKTRHSN